MASTTWDIYHSAKYLYIVLKFLGLAPYRFDKKSLSFKMGFSNYLVFFLSITIYLSLNVSEFQHFHEYNYDTGIQSHLLDQLWQYQYLLQHVLATSIVIFHFLKRKNVEKYLRLISKFDRMIQGMGWRFKVMTTPNCYLMFIIVSVVMLWTFQIIALSIDIYGEINFIVIVKILSFTTINEFFFMIVLQFVLSTYCVYARLICLMKNIR